MAASVTIHHKAFGDRRIAYLGELAGYNQAEALGRMAMLWSLCTELQTDTPSDIEIKSCLGTKGPEALLESELGERDPGGRVRVKGCDGRIEWYGEREVRQVAGGKARASTAQRNPANGQLMRVAGKMLVNAGPATHQQPKVAGPATPASTSQTPASESESDLPEDLSPARARVATPPHTELPENTNSPGKAPEGAGSAAVLVRMRLNSDAWTYAGRAHLALRPEIDPSARAWSAMPTGAAKDDLTAITRELVGDDCVNADFEGAYATVCRSVDVAVAEARAAATLQWFTPSRIWSRSSFWKRAELTPEQAARPRASPSRSGRDQADEPRPRKIQTL